MLNIDTVNQNVRHYIALVTGLDQDIGVRKANQDAPIGSTPYASVLITPTATEGHDSVTYKDRTEDVDVDETRSGHRNVTASINFYKTGAMNFAVQMQGAAYESVNQDFLRANGLGFITASPVRDLTEIDLARYEKRAQLDLFFYVIDSNENVVSSVQQADIETNIDDYTNTIEVRP